MRTSVSQNIKNLQNFAGFSEILAAIIVSLDFQGTHTDTVSLAFSLAIHGV